MISYMSAYGMKATSNITIVLSYVVGQALPYILFTVLFFLYARLYKRIRSLQEPSESEKNDLTEEIKELPEDETDQEDKDFEGKLVEAESEAASSDSSNIESSERLTLLPDGEDE